MYPLWKPFTLIVYLWTEVVNGYKISFCKRKRIHVVVALGDEFSYQERTLLSLVIHIIMYSR